MSELGLAIAVVDQAIDDIAQYERFRRSRKALRSPRKARQYQVDAEDAMDFLVRRIQEPGNLWGTLCEARMTPARLAELVRARL